MDESPRRLEPIPANLRAAATVSADAATHLRKLREQGCYVGLRTGLRRSAIAGVVLALLFFFLAAAGNRGGNDLAYLLTGIGIAGSIWMGYLLSVLLIDIADAVVHSSARRDQE